jgi:hypothetical protein
LADFFLSAPFDFSSTQPRRKTWLDGIGNGGGIARVLCGGLSAFADLRFGFARLQTLCIAAGWNNNAEVVLRSSYCPAASRHDLRMSKASL